MMEEPAAVPREVTLERQMRGFSRAANYRRDQHCTVADRIEERAGDAGARPAG